MRSSDGVRVAFKSLILSAPVDYIFEHDTFFFNFMISVLHELMCLCSESFRKDVVVDGRSFLWTIVGIQVAGEENNVGAFAKKQVRPCVLLFMCFFVSLHQYRFDRTHTCS